MPKQPRGSKGIRHNSVCATTVGNLAIALQPAPRDLPNLSPSGFRGGCQVEHLVEELHLPTQPFETPLRMTAIDNHLIGKGLITRQTSLVTLQSQVLQWVHETPSSGHPGILHTTAFFQNWFWWPTLPRDMENYVKSCAICTQAWTTRQHPTGLLESLPISHYSWSHIAMDLITNLPSSDGYNTILVAIDHFSKAC
ncbi:hypothetical protein QTP86_009168 [Hemibagrus guttatus]|nr:hypothetical protein QTP86_009168 [Hemibagrus guttatus]